MRVDSEAWPMVGLSLVAAVAVGWFWPWLALPPALFAVFTLWFFRDPTRRPPADPSALLAPADGKIIQAGPRRISIFMNVFNVHVCRTPVAGRVERVEHVDGSFLSAFKPEAPEQNERTALEISGPRGSVVFVLVAGLVARRIVCRVERGRTLATGERVGLIRFGSRVDIDLPAAAKCEVRVGERVVAGETVVARYPEPAAAG